MYSSRKVVVGVYYGTGEETRYEQHTIEDGAAIAILAAALKLVATSDGDKKDA